MYVYIYIYIYICTYVYVIIIHVYLCVYVPVSLSLSLSLTHSLSLLHTHTRTNTHTHAHTHTQENVCCQLQTPCFSENKNTKKIIQNIRKCCLQHATNVRFSNFRGWRRISKSRSARFFYDTNHKKCPIIPRFLPESLMMDHGSWNIPARTTLRRQCLKLDLFLFLSLVANTQLDHWTHA